MSARIFFPDCKNYSYWGTWLAQSIEHANLDLGVMISSPTLRVEITLKKKYSYWGASVAQSVKHPELRSGYNLTVGEVKLHNRLSAVSTELALNLVLPVLAASSHSFFLSLPPSDK